MRLGSFKGALLLALTVISVALIISQASKVQAWGENAHQLVEIKAENVFSKGSFFSTIHSTLYYWSTYPDTKRDNFMPGIGAYDWHYLDAISYNPLVVVSGYENGELPWAIEWLYDNIVYYLEAENWSAAENLMGAVCHFAGDSTIPIHAENDYSPGDNGDIWYGYYCGSVGVYYPGWGWYYYDPTHGYPHGYLRHSIFESMVNAQILNTDNISIPDNYVPHQLDNIENAALATLSDSFDLAGWTPTGYIENKLDYYLGYENIFWNDWLRSMTDNRLATAVQFTANIWYSAMIQAGLTIQAPTLTSPSGGSKTTNNKPTFTWTSVSGTSYYDFQLASDNNFTINAVTAKGLTTNFYTPVNALTGGRWYWRVRTGDNSTNVGLWSQIQSFTVLTHAPIYISDNSGFTSPDPVNGGGSGTAGDPYIIENWDISAGSANGIEIQNTTAYFIVRNCYVHDGGDYYNGIFFYNVTNGMLDNNLVENNYWEGICLDNSSNNTICNNIAENTRNIHGIILDHSDNNLIENNTLRNNQQCGIQLINSSNNTICNNIAEDSRTGQGILIQNSDNNLIENNTCQKNYYDGIMLSSSVNNLVFNNTCSTNNGSGIYLWENSDNNLIENNLVENNSWDGMELPDSDNNRVENNTCRNNIINGIHLWENSNNNTISGNIFSNNYYCGIRLSSCGSNNTIFNNKCENNSSDGILLENSDKNLISNNTCKNNGRDGINLFYIYSGGYIGSDNNTLDNNTCSNNLTGIYVSDSDINTITNNTCSSNNSYGIYLGYSLNNRIFHNRFVNNPQQALDYGTDYWDNGYPSGGNYWGDYTGSDANGDGIGDTPYYISGGSNQDRYPLMNWPPTVMPPLKVHIAPYSNIGKRGTVQSFTVYVTNMSSIDNDNYIMTRGDNAGWILALSGDGLTVDNRIENVAIGQGRALTLTVKILDNALSGALDNVWVKATKVDNENCTDNDYCLVHCASTEIKLVTGWNLVGFTAVGATDNPDNLFPGLTYLENFRLIYWVAPGGPYKTQPEGQVLIDNTGYWVWIDENYTVGTSGTAPVS